VGGGRRGGKAKEKKDPKEQTGEAEKLTGGPPNNVFSTTVIRPWRAEKKEEWERRKKYMGEN